MFEEYENETKTPFQIEYEQKKIINKIKESFANMKKIEEKYSEKNVSIINEIQRLRIKLSFAKNELMFNILSAKISELEELL